MDNQELYGPCPCGSGKKYKFCCRTRQRASAGSRPTLRVLPQIEDMPDEAWGELDEKVVAASRQHCDKGLQLLEKGRYKQAISRFRTALKQLPVVYTPANNLALCLYVTGKLDEAIHVQEQSLVESPLPNPFGFANLATFAWLRGDEDRAVRYIDQAIGLLIHSADTCVKVCEVLARMKRHKAILRLVDDSAYREDSEVCFFSGVAAANLDKRARAQRDLRRVGIGSHKAKEAQRYLRHLEEGSAPHTVMGGWPYLFAAEVCPAALLEAELKIDEEGCRQRRILVQFTEALLDEDGTKPLEKLEFLAYTEHPDANDLLWAIVRGSFGPDALRSKALAMLQERGAVQPDEPVEMLLNQKRSTVASVGLALNPEYRFGGKLRRALDKLYTKAVRDSQKPNPDWKKLGRAYADIMRAAPDFYPARYNYAISLLHQNHHAEAEPILRDLNEKHPDYLFAAATLLQLYMMRHRDEEAKALLEAVKLPDETHPSAMVSWMVAQHMYWEEQGESDASEQCLQMVRDLAPGHPILQNRY